jgi:uncharacterized repeat protein (TIGR02543 family)
MFDFLSKPARGVLFALLISTAALFVSACSDSDSGGGDSLTNAETPDITVQPQSATYSQYDTATPLSVTAEISDGGTLSYQWYESPTPSTDGTEIPSATSATYTPVPTDTVGTFYYYVLVTNINPDVDGIQEVSVTSAVAVITVNADAETPVISVQPQNTTFVQGASESFLSVTAGVSDGGSLTYQWYSNDSESTDGGTLLSETSDTLTVLTDTLGDFYYYVVVTNTNNSVGGERTASITSSVATITVALFATANFYESGTLAQSIPVSSVQDITLPAPADISGWTFDGWYIDNDGTPQAVSSTYNLTANTAFYARWIPDTSTPKVKAVFYDDGIEVSSIEEYAVNYITLPTAITKDVYTFNGWKVGETAASPVYSISANTDFNAEFTLDATCTPITAISGLQNISLDSTTLSGCYKLINEINLNGAEWTPIGTDSAPFTGVFEGNGQTIKGLKIDAASNNYVGLFGYIGGARIANLTVEITGTGVKGGTNTGGIAGYAVGVSDSNPVKIVNTHVKREGDTPEIKGSSYNGGILGYSGNYVTVSNCSNDVPIGATGISAGGILGYSPNTVPSMIKIYNSYNTGDVSVSIASGATYIYAGGIAGYAGIFITDSHNTGEVTAEATANGIRAYSGGIIGSGTVEIIHNHNTGAVSATSTNQLTMAGGITGSLSGSVTNSHNIGTVFAKTRATSGTTYGNAGGIAGDQNSGSTISGSYNTGNVTADTGNSRPNAGGITGRYNNVNTISKSYNTGNVTVSSNNQSSYVGGIVGNGGGDVSATYNTGNVRGTSTSGGVYAAGIAGYIGTCTDISKNVAANSNVTVTTSSSAKAPNRVVASASSSILSNITNNIALNTMTGSVNNSAYTFPTATPAYYGDSATADELKTQATYEAIGWEFCDGVTIQCDETHPWKMPSAEYRDNNKNPTDGTYFYPLLYWE